MFKEKREVLLEVINGANRIYQIKPRWTTAVYLVSCDRTQELGLSLLGRVPMPALYPHTSLVYSSYYHNIHIYSLCLHTSFLRVISHHGTLKPATRRLPLVKKHYRTTDTTVALSC